MDLFVFGFGYSAGYFYHQFKHDIRSLALTQRTAGSGELIASSPSGDDPKINPYRFDGSYNQDLLPALNQANAIIVSIPPGQNNDPVLTNYRRQLMDSRTEIICYLSSLSVYGDHKGEWVDENTLATPTTSRGSARLNAENAWRDFAAVSGKSVVILRLGGIYGPKRNPLQKIINGTARSIIKNNQVFNRIHVEDIATTIMKVLNNRQEYYPIVNVCDDLPSPPQEVMDYAAHLLEVKPPAKIPFADARLSTMEQSFFAECKRVRNNLLKQKIRVKLKYPTYKQGLEALVKQINQ